MSYDNNDLGYDIGYDSDFIPSRKSPSIQNFQSNPNRIVYYAIEPTAAGNAAQKGVFIPLDEPKKDEPKDESNASVLLGVLEGGKNDGQLLIQDRSTGKSAVISKDIASQYGIGEGDISHAKKIPATNFAAGQPGLGKVEKNKTPVDGPAPAGKEPATNPAKIADEAKAARWTGPDGDLYKRAQTYGLNDDSIKELKNQNLTPDELDKKLPPITKGLDDKNPKEKKTELDRRQKVKAELSVETAGSFKTQQSDSLYKRFNTKADGSEKKPGDPGYVSRENCEAMVVQRYKMGDPSVDLDDPKVDINKVTAKKTEVDGWISSVPKGSEKGVTEEKIEGGKEKFTTKDVYDRALASERGKATDLIKKDFKEKEVNPQLFLADKGATSAGDIRKWRIDAEKNRKDPAFLKDQQAQIKTFESGVDPKTSEGNAKRKELTEKIGVVEKPKLTGKAKDAYDQAEGSALGAEVGKDKDEERKIKGEERTEEAEKRREARAEESKIKAEKRAKADEIEREERQKKKEKEFAMFQGMMQRSSQSIGNLDQNTVASAFKMIDKQEDRAWKGLEMVSSASNQMLTAMLNGAIGSLFPGKTR